MDTLSDIELWLLVQNEDRQAFSILYNRHWESSYQVCYWLLMDQEAAWDIVQELFINLWEKKEHINISKTFEGYLKVALRNRVFNYIKSTNDQRKRKVVFDERIEKAGAAAAQEIIYEKELRHLYQLEVQKLPEKMKQILVLNKEEGCTVAEIAKRLSLSEQTVRNQLTSALKRIRSGLEHYRILTILLTIYLCFFNK